MDQLKNQDQKSDNISTQIENAKGQIIGHINDESIKTSLESSENTPKGSPVKYGSYKLLREKCEKQGYNPTAFYKFLTVDQMLYNSFDNYVKYAEDNSCWSYEYNNWKLYTFLEWFNNNIAKSYPEAASYIEENFFGDKSRDFAVEITPEEYEENREFYDNLIETASIELKTDK